MKFITILSFAYESGVPVCDPNDRLYVIDCRTIKDPMWENFGTNTGRDDVLIQHFSQQESMQEFLKHTRDFLFFLEEQSYTVNDLRNTIIAFGCTHGRHRSVYCADVIAKDFFEKYHRPIFCNHIQQQIQYEL